MSLKTILTYSALLASASADVFTQHFERALLEARLDTGIDQNASDYYLGYKPSDYNTSWGKYFNDTPIELNPEFQAGLAVSWGWLLRDYADICRPRQSTQAS